MGSNIDNAAKKMYSHLQDAKIADFLYNFFGIWWSPIFLITGLATSLIFLSFFQNKYKENKDYLIPLIAAIFPLVDISVILHMLINSLKNEV